MKKILVSVPAQSQEKYPIVVGSGALQSIPDLIQDMKDVDHTVILYDKNLEDIATKLSNMIPSSERISVPSGEGSKCLSQVERITQDLLLKNATRKSVLINVGGGMLTDLGGFVASTYMRGIRFINVSTSLLGMIDASIGGKTGVDLGLVKNIIGTFAHPKAVIVDTDVLGSLPDQQLKEGMVEVIKIAAMRDAEFFGWLEESLHKILDRDANTLSVCIQKAAALKVAVVENDEKERGIRLFLNFGHTVGHAVEALSRFSLAHGTAVSIGMICEMDMMNSEGKDRVATLLKRLDMPVVIPIEMRNKAIWDIMQNDKKVIGRHVHITAPKKIGLGEAKEITFEDFAHARS